VGVCGIMGDDRPDGWFGQLTGDVAGSVGKRREKCRKTLTITPPSKVQCLDAPSRRSWSKCLQVVMVEGGEEAI